MNPEKEFFNEVGEFRCQCCRKILVSFTFSSTDSESAVKRNTFSRMKVVSLTLHLPVAYRTGALQKNCASGWRKISALCGVTTYRLVEVYRDWGRAFKTEAASTFETSANFYQTTQRHDQ